MQVTCQVSSPSRFLLNQGEAQQAANDYLQTYVATAIETASPIFVPHACPTWRMLAQLSNRPETATVGTITVDAQTGKVIPLTDEQIEDMCDRIKEYNGETKGVLRPTAQIRANGYLTNYVSLFAKADRPVWVDGNPPVWRATAYLRASGHSRICDLGVIEVNAQTGEVVPFTNQQLQAMRKSAQDAVTCAPQTAATSR